MIDYKKSGVDIDKADEFIDGISKLTIGTKRKEIIGGIGGFSSICSVSKKYKSPVIVSSTDGVGTKLMVAKALNKHDTIGIDLVAMCVNDVVTTGAEPVFFLDYFATGKLNKTKATSVIRGIVKGCKDAGCSLIGGETAEMPGMYKGDEYDLAGFAVGLIERNKIIDGSKVKKGDFILGIESSGLHSNGFSLARKLFTEKELKGKIGRILLTPTIIYVKVIRALLKSINIKSLAHITGSGFYGNIPRVMPKNKSALIYKEAWPTPRIFKIMQGRASLSDKEMYNTFNMGIGMVVVLDKRDAKKAHSIIKKHNLRSWTIGDIVEGKGEVIL